jgi:hypothetical protein
VDGTDTPVSGGRERVARAAPARSRAERDQLAAGHPRAARTHSSNATLTVSGTTGQLVSISWFCRSCAPRSPSSGWSWRFIRVATARQASWGPPPPVARHPGQPLTPPTPTPREARTHLRQPGARLFACRMRAPVLAALPHERVPVPSSAYYSTQCRASGVRDDDIHLRRPFAGRALTTGRSV